MSNPIAQSFNINPQYTQGQDGLYVTKMDLFFQNADPDYGFTLELRHTDPTTGLPNTEILPYSQCHVSPASILVSNTANVATTVTFSSPIYLQSSTQYAFVVTPDGGTPNHLIWTSVVGANTVANTALTAKNEWGFGALFTPTTDQSSWIPNTTESIMFNLYNANFTTNAATVTLTNTDDEYFSLNNINGAFIAGERIFRFTNTPIAGTVSFANTSNVVIGVSTTFQTTFEVGSSIVLHNYYAPSLANGYYSIHTVTSISSNTSLVVDSLPPFSSNGGCALSTPIGECYVYDANSASITLTNSTAANATFSFYAGDYIIGELSGAVACVNTVDSKPISYIQPLVYRTHVTGTNITGNINYTDSTFTETGSAILDFANNNYFDNFQAVVASTSLEVQTGHGKSLIKPLTLSTNYSIVSPVIDITATSYVRYCNIINNDDRFENKTFGKGASKYIGEIVTLNDGLDAEDLHVYLTSYEPPTTAIQVYVRALNAHDPDSLNTKSWTQLGRQTPLVNCDPTNRHDFKEFSYYLNQFPPTTTLDGAISGNNSSTTILGINSLFTSETAVGDTVIITDGGANSAVFKITAVTDDTHLSISGIPAFTFTGGSIFKFDDPNAIFKDPANSNTASYFSNTTFYSTYLIWQLKVLLLSDQTNVVPRVTDLRALALT